MAKLKEGVKAPQFNLQSSNGEKVALKDFKGKKRVVLYFYPKDNTPGCTVEACEFRDDRSKIEKAGAVILGVSPDGLSDHEKFVKKFKLPFLLLSDENKKICRAYGVWVKKSMYGRSYMGVARSTFVIGKKGKIEKIYSKVKPEGHSDEILDFLRSEHA
ncbi:MAG: thioredoxin-dependent thiol peroxidase [Candidatus Omnitrophota bacterium]|nr:thioredoxin-dependent thiol peroxidase [Candidatus Omnitrophota bacterium]